MNLNEFQALCADHQLTVHANANARYSAKRPNGRNALHSVAFRQAGGMGTQGYFSVRPRDVRPHEVQPGPDGYDVWSFKGTAYTLTGPGHARLRDVIDAGQLKQVLAVLTL